MQTLRNIAFGAILASLSLAPTAWADASQMLNAPLAGATSTIAGTQKVGSPFDHAVSTVRGVLARLPASAHLSR